MSIFTEAYAHKTGYKHNHGGGNGNVPEIDGNSIVTLITVLVVCYLMFYYARKKK